MTEFEKRVSAFIEREGLLDRSSLHLVAVSGGADSVCLLLLLKNLSYRVEAVHCNFHLRGEESDRDEAFVAALCRDNGVELHLAHFDTHTYATLHHVSIEMAARELRYSYFEQLRRDTGASSVCVAHHSDDNVETVLMNILRGTGLRGLQGIQPRRDSIVRPLLCVSRKEIEQWLSLQGQTYVTDSTNKVADVVRNKLRLEIIPRLSDIFPQAADNILSTARFASQALRVYDHAIGERLSQLQRSRQHFQVIGHASQRDNQAANSVSSMEEEPSQTSIDIGELLREPSAEALLFEWLNPAGFSSHTVMQIASVLPSVASGREWTSATHTLITHDGQLLLSKTTGEPKTMTIPEPGTYIYDEETKYSFTLLPNCHIERGDILTCCADAATVAFPLTLRPVRQGDRFRPLGMKGSRLVSDFLTDLHLPLTAKRRQMVLCDATGKIVWIVGRRMDDTHKVTPQTEETLVIIRKSS